MNTAMLCKSGYVALVVASRDTLQTNAALTLHQVPGGIWATIGAMGGAAGSWLGRRPPPAAGRLLSRRQPAEVAAAGQDAARGVLE